MISLQFEAAPFRSVMISISPDSNSLNQFEFDFGVNIPHKNGYEIVIAFPTGV